MAGISNYLADFINDWLHGNTASYSPSSTTYFALMTTLPTASGGGTEVTGGSYIRLAVTNNVTNWPVSVSGLKANGIALTWAIPTADWGFVLGIAEYDASTAGNLLTFTPLDTPLFILTGQQFTMDIGAFRLRWLGISQYLANKLNDWLHGGGTYTVPTTTYFGLMSTPSTTTGVGVETTGAGYARVTDTNTAIHWPASAGQTKVNANAFIWGPAGAAWTGPEVSVTEFDALSGGNILTFGPLASPATVPLGASPTVPTNGAVYVVG